MTLEIGGLTVRFGGVTALSEVDLTVRPGELVGLIGPNGAGKTTLFDCLTRRRDPVAGRMRFETGELGGLAPYEVARRGIARTFQHLGLFPGLSVRENVMVGAHRHGRSGFGAAALRLGRSRREEQQIRRITDGILEHMDLLPLADHPAAHLPHGTLKRIEIARALAVRPRLLLLDEPISGLGQDEAADIGRVIQDVHSASGAAIIVVEHHMGFVMGLCDRIVCLDSGRKIADGPPDRVGRDPAVIDACLGVAP
ncbi:ABC transporter ATP-binding protein [Planobispora rosea]|uniref:ABC transporter ATP-binding protein n=1 Tax=Planobispora rosea TaxID=35762 RepID=A0A8J3WH62_PLARO|nr:ABC transporter ATP-binding protein [Planobispora rosea]GGS95416.1 ABC transporter ATP-binding protein [Planobispora rosea]GIH87526.1 ABC transporter ATP-binding protein [Planobispora rosea]